MGWQSALKFRLLLRMVHQEFCIETLSDRSNPIGGGEDGFIFLGRTSNKYSNGKAK